jgi:type 1 glutamine amidotransferase
LFIQWKRRQEELCKVRRKTVLRNVTLASRCGGVLLTLFLLASAAGLAQEDPRQPYLSAKRPRVLMNSGCSSQSAEFPRRALSEVLTTVNFPVTFIEDTKLIDRQTLQQFDVFIQSGSVRMSRESEQALWDFVQNGGGFLGLHNASDGPQGGPYEKLLGGRFLRHPPPYHIMIRVTDAGRKHPVTAGVQDFEIYDEHHFVRYDVDPVAGGSGALAAALSAVAGRAPGYSAADLQSARSVGAPHVLLNGEAMDNSMDELRVILGEGGVSRAIAGWWREIGKGRVVFFSPGHTAEVMRHPMMQRLYQNAVRWLAKQD